MPLPNHDQAPSSLTDLLALCSTRSTRARTLAAFLWLRCGGYRRYRNVDWKRVKRLIFVCKGNVCRSPYAEAAARRAGLPTASCGVHASGEGAANPTAIEVAAARGLDLNGHCPRAVDELTPGRDDLLIAMEPWHAEVLVGQTANAGAQVTLLGLWGALETPSIPDPYGRPRATFGGCFELVEQGLSGVSRRLRLSTEEGETNPPPLTETLTIGTKSTWAWKWLKRTYLRCRVLLGRRVTGKNGLRARLELQSSPQGFVQALKKLIRSNTTVADLHETLNYAGETSWRFDRATGQSIVQEVIDNLPIENVSEAVVRRAKTLNVSLRASFRLSLTLRSKKRELHQLAETRLNDKQAAYRFADALGVSRPRLFQEHVPFASINRREGIVIKPATGSASNGVYVVFGDAKIFDVKAGAHIETWNDMERHVRSKLAGGIVSSDRWLAEELISAGDKPANDIKCYVFYGRVALILQVSRYPTLCRRWVDRNGCVAQTGKYTATFSGDTNSALAAADLAEKISAEIPAPFLRIDLLDGDEGLMLGEFTPRPGGYHEFNDATDQWLGTLFLDAEERLVNDLLAGKDFPHFRETFTPLSAPIESPSALCDNDD